MGPEASQSLSLGVTWMRRTMPEPAQPEEVAISADAARLGGTLTPPTGARAIVIFAHGSGSSRFSPRNRLVAGALHAAGLGTLLFDLLTEHESGDRANVFNIPLLARRLGAAVRWARDRPDTRDLALGLFGASTGAAAALVAAAGDAAIRAVVSRGGRPDLAADALARVKAPTLLIVGGEDGDVIDLNRAAFDTLRCEKDLVIVPGAGHLFEEPGCLEHVAHHARAWFTRHLAAAH